MADANDLTELPARMRSLPLDSVGRPIPAFAALVDGDHDFRVADPDHLMRCIKHGMCWVCGKPLGSQRATFLVGPMCVVNRVSSEPPSHDACAAWSASHCPFLVNPEKVRREAHLPENLGEPPGVMIRRNPGVVALYETRGWTFQVHPGDHSPLFTMGEPARVQWLCRGREATTEEVLAALDSGIPALRELCVTDREHKALDDALDTALALVP